MINFYDFQKTSKSFFLAPNNLRFYASMVDPTVSINSRVIHVGAGTANARFLTVPLAGPSELTMDTVIRITVGLKPKRVDSDPYIGISDGTTVNEFQIVDTGNYGSFSPCRLINGVHENTRVPTSTPPYSEVTLTFMPYRRYGTCRTAQNGGYVNAGTFNAQLDITKGLSLVVKREHAGEVYDFYYFQVEIMTNRN